MPGDKTLAMDLRQGLGRHRGQGIPVEVRGNGPPRQLQAANKAAAMPGLGISQVHLCFVLRCHQL